MDVDSPDDIKLMLVVCDGLADRPVEELEGKTPLQYADYPNFDWFARNGICGIMDTIAPGVPPGSDTAHLALFGLDPFKVYSGRGPFEAFGIGMDVGILYKSGIKIAGGNLNFSGVINNLGTGLKFIDKRNPFPLIFRLGMSSEI